MSDHKGRVSSGNPALTPAFRSTVDSLHASRDKSRVVVEDSIKRDQETSAPDGDIPTTNPLAQMGRSMSRNIFQNKLRALNPFLHFEVSIADPTKVGIYDISNGKKQFIMGMENGPMPEFSVRHTEIKSVPDCGNPGSWKTVEVLKDETRGWRTVLARLIRAGYVQPSVAEKAFAVTSGRDSKNWKELVR